MLDGGLQHAERPRLERLSVVLERAGEWRDAREATLGQITADLEFRVRPRFEPPKDLQHVAIAEERDAVALVAAGPDPLALRQNVDRRGHDAPDTAARRRDLFALPDDCQQPIARLVVLHAVDDQAFARAGDASEHGRR